MQDTKTSAEALPANFIFRPLSEFKWWDESNPSVLIGHYVPGNTYNCAAIERHKRLRVKCAEWLDRGLIAITAVGGFKITEHQIKQP